MKKYDFLWLFFIGVFFFLSCERRPLVNPEEAAVLKIRLRTDNIPNVTCDIYNEEVQHPVITSDMMRVFIYNRDGSFLLSQGFLQNKTEDEHGFEVIDGAVVLSPGDYSLIGYNFDVESTFIKHESNFNSICAYTDEIPEKVYARFGSRADGMGKVYYQPEHLLVAREPSLFMDAHLGLKTIELDAFTVVDTYYIQIRISGGENMAANAAALAVLSGLSQYSFIGQGVPGGEMASVYFEMKKSTDPRIDDENQDVLCAVFNTFGRLEDVPSDLKVTFSVLTRNGEIHQKEIDMSAIFETEDALKRHWLLIDEVWELPEIQEEGTGGFAPAVDEWDDIEEEIHIGPSKRN